eukprot:c22639_g3_i4 orf=725-949(+)
MISKTLVDSSSRFPARWKCEHEEIYARVQMLQLGVIPSLQVCASWAEMLKKIITKFIPTMGRNAIYTSAITCPR